LYVLQSINKHTNAMMNPKYLLLNFEQVMSNGFKDVFPNVIIVRDRFHFVQANIKYLNELGLQHLVTEVSKNLNVLWTKPIKEDFDKYLNDDFLQKWNRRVRQYSDSYFD
jgi:hypothetical protein